MMDELDNEIFICCKCGNKFNHTDGTWLPISEGEPNFMKHESGSIRNPPIVYSWDLRPPDIITSNDFTCYDCCN